MKAQFFHTKSKARVTVCAISMDGMLFFNASKCMKTDKYNPKVGNSIALGRLKKGNCMYCVKDGRGHFQVIAKRIAKAVASNGETLKQAGKFFYVPETPEVGTISATSTVTDIPVKAHAEPMEGRYLQPEAAYGH